MSLIAKWVLVNRICEVPTVRFSSVLPRMLWIEFKVSAEEEDCDSEVFKFSVSSPHGFDFLNFAVDSFGSGVGLMMAERIADAIKVFLEPLCNFDDFLHGGLLDTGEPKFSRSLLRRTRCIRGFL